jgi:uncharacterized membrane protein YfcA
MPDLETTIAFVSLLAAAGLAAGFFSGLFGISGGGIIVPILFETFRTLRVPDEVLMPLCVGTSLAIVLLTTTRSYGAHKALSAANSDTLRTWALPAVLGAVCGSIVAAFVFVDFLKIVFIVVTFLMALRLLAGTHVWAIGQQLPSTFVMRLYGYVVGFIASLIGVGGGALATAILTLHGKPVHEAIRESAGIGIPVTLVGTAGYIIAGWRYNAILPPFSLGYVSLIGFALVAPAGALLAPVGARVAHSLPKRTLEIWFGIFLMVMVIRFVINLFWKI